MANISERKVILYTAGFVVLAGMIRLVAYSVGSVLFYLAFVPFLAYRGYSIYNQPKEKRTSLQSYRFFVLVVMGITLILNIAGWQDADFFLIFLLMVDYLLVINRKF